MPAVRKSPFKPVGCEIMETEYNSQFNPKLSFCERKSMEPRQHLEDEDSKREVPKPKPLRYIFVSIGEFRIMAVFRKDVPTVPVRMLETLLLKNLERGLLMQKFNRLHLCESSYMTEPEVWLFNLLKDQHITYVAARRLVFDMDDRVVTLTDALALEPILRICNRRQLMNRNHHSEHFGFVLIAGCWVPYVVIRQRRWFLVYPLERRLRTLAFTKCEDIKNWHLAWLKLAMRLIGQPSLLDCLAACPCIVEPVFTQLCKDNGIQVDLTERWPINEVFQALPHVNKGLPAVDFVWTKMPPVPAHKLTAEWYRQSYHEKMKASSS